MIEPKLRRREAAGNPIKVAWVGAGRMITGAITQTAQMKGMRNAVICDIQLDRAYRAHEINGAKREDIVAAKTAGAANDALRAGKPVVTDDAMLLPQLEVDCLVEGTGVPEVGAEVALRSIQAGKHIIMLNVETDVVIGPTPAPDGPASGSRLHRLVGRRARPDLRACRPIPRPRVPDRRGRQDAADARAARPLRDAGHGPRRRHADEDQPALPRDVPRRDQDRDRDVEHRERDGPRDGRARHARSEGRHLRDGEGLPAEVRGRHPGQDGRRRLRPAADAGGWLDRLGCGR